MQKIAVLMTCYNRVDTTLECLRRLFEQEIPEGYFLDVWLVDDASPDKTGERVKMAYPQVNVIRGSGNLFWAGGMREAWTRAAKENIYDYYFWLNDDVRLSTGALTKILRASNALENSAIVCGALIDPKTGTIFYGARGVSFPEEDMPVLVEKGMHGNVVLIPYKVFDKIGGMATGLVHQHGDFEYGFRARKNGIAVYAVPPIGTCDANYGFDKKKMLNMSLKQRFKALFSPKQIGLSDYCRYKFLTVGLFGCIASYLKGIILALFPNVMIKRDK